MAHLAIHLLALPPSGGEALLLAHKVSDSDWLVPALLPWLITALLARLVPALLLGDALAHLLGLVPALLPRLVPALAVRIADLLGDGGALLLYHSGADLLQGGAALASHRLHADLLGGGGALPPRLGPGNRHLDRLALGGWLVPALLLPDGLADGSNEDAGQGLAEQEGEEDQTLHGIVSVGEVWTGR